MTAKVLVFPNNRVFPAIIATMHTFVRFHLFRFWLQSNPNLLEEWKNGRMEKCNNSIIRQFENGRMEKWKDGRMCEFDPR
jgi:hypothetical protein